MSADSTEMLSAIVKLTPVLVGAIIGVLGGLVGTTYAHKLSSATSKLKEKREKLEKLVTEVYEIDVWLKKQENYYLYGGEEILEQSPMSKIEAIESLYFPELNKQVSELSGKLLDYRGWLVTGARLRLAGNSATPPKEHLDKLNEHYAPLKQSIDNVISKAKEISRSLNAS